ncbi:MAG: general secretion pathway protein GspB [Rhodocyclales bacterium]|nr:general secretion pathway protein GspB [Rhodocyclales bacterium]
MSYILEALTKSEQARLQQAGAMRYSLLPASGENARPRRSRAYAILGGLLLLNGALLYPRLYPNAAPTPRTESTTKPLTRSGAVAPPRQAATPPQLATPQPAVPPLAVPPQVASQTASEPVRPAPSGSVSTPPPQAVATPKAAVAASTGIPAAPLRAAERADPQEMPADLLKDLPPLAVAGYIHDTDANNMVLVNEKLLREGDEIAPGLKLEKILGDGVVFNYKGYRFKR